MGWAEILRGLLAFRGALRRPFPWQREVHLSRVILVMVGSAGLLRGIASGVLPDPRGSTARRLQRAASILIVVALGLTANSLRWLRKMR